MQTLSWRSDDQRTPCANPGHVKGLLKPREWQLDANSSRLAWLNSVVASPWVSHRARRNLLRQAGIGIGSSHLDPGFRFIGGTKLRIGHRCYLNAGCIFDAGAEILIEDDVAVGDHVRFITSGHAIGPSQNRCGDAFHGPIRVGPGSWIGSGAMLLPGVKLGRGCVVGAGAVVTRSTEPNGLYLGLPARRVRDLPP